jgi:shikimate kinase
MMGSGKSTVGRVLASVLKYCFFDSDAVLEDAVGGASVSDVFEANGEAGFRDLEASVLAELSAYRNCVIATGGGVVNRCAPPPLHGRPLAATSSRAREGRQCSQ